MSYAVARDVCHDERGYKGSHTRVLTMFCQRGADYKRSCIRSLASICHCEREYKRSGITATSSDEQTLGLAFISLDGISTVCGIPHTNLLDLY